MPSPNIHLKIQNRHGALLETDVTAFSSFNTKGLFDILPGHANFISFIQKKLIYYSLDGSKHEYNLDKAILRVYENKAEVFLSVTS